MKYLALATLLGLVGFARCDLLRLLGREPELSIFRESLTGASWLRFLEEEGSFTVFAPTNRAIESFGRASFELLADANKKSYLRNFFAQVAIRSDKLPTHQVSFHKGSSLLYLTKLWEDGQERMYVNEAQVIREAAGTAEIIVYVIDRVPNFKQFENVQPNAEDLLKNLDVLFGLKGLSVEGFRESVEQQKLSDLFSEQRGTFFFPMIQSRNKRITKEIIEAHIIPGKVLFTPHFQHGRFQSMAWREDGNRYQISLVNETDNNVSNLLIRSTMSVGQSEKSSVVARLHMANVPVENGVVHFIESPLGFASKSVWDYVQDEKESRHRFNDFVEIIKESVEFKAALRKAEIKTLFIPSNHAVRVLPVDVWNQYKSNITELTKLLKYHLVTGQIVSEDSLRSSSGVVTTYTAASVPLVVREVQCTSGCTFNSGANKSLLVECSGVNATVLSADIGTTNGVIHIIDRVLGAPSHSLGWKLQNSEPLATTQAVATKGHWNKKLDNPNSRYTLFAPNNQAWHHIDFDDYDKLVRQPTELHDQAASIMDRHLVDLELSRSELMRMAELRTVRGDRILVSHENDRIQLLWKNQVCSVLNSDIQATNGVIHIIDCVLMESNDLVSKAQATTSSLILVFTSVFALIFFIGRH